MFIGKTNELKVKDKNEKGIMLYQSLLQYNPGELNWDMFNDDALTRSENIEQIKRKELNQFNKLLKEKKISKSFHSLIKHDRDCFYAFVSAWLFSWDLIGMYRNQETNTDTDDIDSILSKLSATFEKYNRIIGI